MARTYTQAVAVVVVVVVAAEGHRSWIQNCVWTCTEVLLLVETDVVVIVVVVLGVVSRSSRIGCRYGSGNVVVVVVVVVGSR